MCGTPSGHADGPLLLVGVSCSYMWVQSVSALILVRIVHGAAFCPPDLGGDRARGELNPGEKSEQAFSAIGVATMIPYAVIPPWPRRCIPRSGTTPISMRGIGLRYPRDPASGRRQRRIGKALRGMDGVSCAAPPLPRSGESAASGCRPALGTGSCSISPCDALLFSQGPRPPDRRGDVGSFSPCPSWP